MSLSPSLALSLSSTGPSLGAIPDQFVIVMGAGVAVAGGRRATAFDGRGTRRRAWIGALPAARDVVEGILREQESHYCCADGPTWIVQRAARRASSVLAFARLRP